MANATRQVSIFINGKEVENTIKSIAAEKKKLQNEVAKLVRGTDEYEAKVAELAKLEPILREHNNAIRGIEGAYKKNIPAVQSFLAAGAGLFAVDRIMDYGQQLGQLAVQTDALARKSQTVLAEELGRVTAAAEKNASAMGLTTAQYVSATAGIADLLIPMGFQRKEAADISVQLQELSGALSEWSGGQKSSAEASHALSAALLGEREELKSYGIALSEEDVKQRLVKKGMEDLTGERLAQAKAIATLELVLEKSTDAQNSYADNTDSLIRQQAELRTKFAEISENLARIFVPIITRITSVTAGLVSVFASLTGEISESVAATNPAIKAAEGLIQKYEREQTSINTLVARITEYNTGTDERKRLIGELQTKYPDFLKNLNTEKVTNEQLTQRLQEVNKQYLARITVATVSKAIVEAQQNEATVAERASYQMARAAKGLGDARIFLKDATLTAEQAHQKLSKAFKDAPIIGSERYRIREIIQGLNATQGVNEFVELTTKRAADATTAAKKQVEETVKTLKEQFPQLAKEFDSIINQTPTATPTNTEGSKDPESDKAKSAREKREKEIADFYDRMKEQATAFNFDLNKINTEGVEKEVLAIQEKYGRIFKTIEEFKTKYPDQAKAADVEAAKFTRLQNDEIRAVYVKRFEDIEAALVKHQSDVQGILLSEEEKQIAQINAKYDKEISLSTALQRDSENATAAERAKAHYLRVQLEAARETEIANLKTKIRSEQLAKDAEGNNKFFADMQKLRDDTQALLNLEPVAFVDPNAASDEQDKQKAAKIQADADEEIRVVKEKFDKQIKAEGDAGDVVAKLRQKRADLIKGIEKKSAAEIEKIEEDSLKKRVAANLALAGQLGNIFVALADLVEGETVKNSNLQKAAALFQLAVDTATAISAVTAKNAQTSLTPIDYAIRVAAAVATVLVNIGKARAVLNAAPEVRQKYEGGYAQVTGAQDRRKYRAQVNTNFEGGLAPLPTLLVGERGPEYVIPDYLLKNPLVANFTRIIESIRLNRTVASPQRYEGGSTTEGVSLAASDSASAAVAIVDNRAVDLLQGIYDALLAGRISAVVDTEGALKIDAAIQYGKKLGGY